MKVSESALPASVIIGRGRVGRSLARAMRLAGGTVELRGREDGLNDLAGRVVVLCVPDGEIAALTAGIKAAGRPRLVGHTSGVTSLAPLTGAGTEGEFSVHPLQTVPDGETDLTGCPAAVAGSSPKALGVAREIAAGSGMRPFAVADEDRATYHAAASIASNYLVTIEQTAAELLGGISVEEPRSILEPLVRRTLENWLERGSDALTGPIARGDAGTVESHRRALADHRPDLLPIYDALAERTRQLAGRKEAA